MITNPYVVRALLAAAALLLGALLVHLLAPYLTRAWNKATPLGRCLFLFAAATLALYGGNKAPLRSAPARRTAAAAGSSDSENPTVAPEGYRLVAVMPARGHDFNPAEGDEVVTNLAWLAHGAHEAWCSVGSFSAFTGGYLRPTPRAADGQVGLFGDGFLYAAPGVSRFWSFDRGYASIATWQDFFRDATTNDPVSVQVRLADPYCTIYAGNWAYHYEKPYNPTNDITLHLTINAPRGVVSGGSARPVTVDCQSDINLSGWLSVDCTQGSEKIQCWEDQDGTIPLSLPCTFDAECFEDFTFYVSYGATSERLDDITFEVTLEGPEADDGDAPFTMRSAHMTAATFDRVEVFSSASGQSPCPPPFTPEDWAEEPETPQNPGRHLVIPRSNVCDENGSFVDFSVTARVRMSPDGYADGSVAWIRLEPSPRSGVLVAADSDCEAEFRNPREGGVYHFAASVDGVSCGWKVVLPLAGAGMDAVLADDLARADEFANWKRRLLTKRWYTRIACGALWFCTKQTGYYRGRPDNLDSPTPWHYNQVSDTDGLGAVGTLAGYPIRVEKLSNLIAGYACEKLGVPYQDQLVSQLFGTSNGQSAWQSWRAGMRLANGISWRSALSYLGHFIRTEHDAKTDRLWPNPAPADNHTGSGWIDDFDTQFSSPGFLDFEF